MRFFRDMWEMISEMIGDIPRMLLSGDWLEKIVAVLFLVALIVAVLLIIWFLYWAIDSWFRPEYRGEGIVANKTFTPAHSTIYMMMVGKIMIPQTTYHPDSWDIAIRINDGRIGSVGVTQGTYLSLKDGNKVDIIYTCGRLSGGIYIKRFAN